MSPISLNDGGSHNILTDLDLAAGPGMAVRQDPQKSDQAEDDILGPVKLNNISRIPTPTNDSPERDKIRRNERESRRPGEELFTHPSLPWAPRSSSPPSFLQPLSS